MPIYFSLSLSLSLSYWLSLSLSLFPSHVFPLHHSSLALSFSSCHCFSFFIPLLSCLQTNCATSPYTILTTWLLYVIWIIFLLNVRWEGWVHGRSGGIESRPAFGGCGGYGTYGGYWEIFDRQEGFLSGAEKLSFFLKNFQRLIDIMIKKIY